MSHFEEEAVDTTVENTPVEETVEAGAESDATEEAQEEGNAAEPLVGAPVEEHPSTVDEPQAYQPIPSDGKPV